ncbi:unnamed protein product [Mortierella alpina]
MACAFGGAWELSVDLPFDGCAFGFELVEEDEDGVDDEVDDEEYDEDDVLSVFEFSWVDPELAVVSLLADDTLMPASVTGADGAVALYVGWFCCKNDVRSCVCLRSDMYPAMNPVFFSGDEPVPADAMI